MRLLARVREQPASIELFDRNAAVAICKKVHGVTPALCSRAWLPARWGSQKLQRRAEVVGAAPD